MSAADAPRRRDSLGHALGKFIAAMKRMAPVSSSSSSRTGTPAHPTTTVSRGSISRGTQTECMNQNTSSCTSCINQSTPLSTPHIELPNDFNPNCMVEVDPDIEDNDNPLLPFYSRVGRPRTSESRMDPRFAKYGIEYRRAGDEPPNKVRRVARSIRQRVRWTCHRCETVFGKVKICSQCEHRRCDFCSRSPPVKIKDVLDTAKQAQHAQRHKRARDDAAVASQKEQDRITARNDSDLPVETSLLKDALDGSLTADEGPSDNGDEDPIPTPAGLLSYARRPTSLPATQYVHRPKGQIIRRICHECDTQILPASRSDCQNCGHVRCTLCPRLPAKREKWPHGSPGDEKPPASASTAAGPSSANAAKPAVLPPPQRVHKPVRQRVRWTCEQCQTLFSSARSSVCDGCGHTRCPECIREPPDRRPTVIAEDTGSTLALEPENVQPAGERVEAFLDGLAPTDIFTAESPILLTSPNDPDEGLAMD